MRRVAVIGVGCTKVGEHWNLSLRDLFADAASKALEDSGTDRLDALYVGNMCSGFLQVQEHLGPLMSDLLGKTGISTAKIEAACASGGMAMHVGFQAVASGVSDYVMVGGVEKMTDNDRARVTAGLMMAEDREYSAYTGVSFVGLNALMARYYMQKYDTSPEDIAQFPVLCHRHGANNPFAQFQSPITVDAVLKSPMVADPLHLLECSGMGDGAAAVLLCPMEEARKITDTPIEVLGSGAANDTLSLHDREDLTTLKASTIAAEKAFKMAKIDQENVDVLEVHDAFSIMGILAYEDLGFTEKGRGAKLVVEGQAEIGGKLPTNTSGGLKARGHPVGATGVYQIVELTKQLRSEAGKNQVGGAGIGFAQNIGGIGATITAHILGRPD